MPFSEKIKRAPEISGTKLRGNLSLQDALIIIAMYAAQMDTAAGGDEKVRRIASLAKKHHLFSEEYADIAARINRLAESVDMRDFPQAVDRAVKSLTLKLRQTAFEWAAELAVDNGILLEEKQRLIEQLRMKLFIDTNTANKKINKAIAKSER